MLDLPGGERRVRFTPDGKLETSHHTPRPSLFRMHDPQLDEQVQVYQREQRKNDAIGGIHVSIST